MSYNNDLNYKFSDPYYRPITGEGSCLPSGTLSNNNFGVYPDPYGGGTYRQYEEFSLPQPLPSPSGADVRYTVHPLVSNLVGGAPQRDADLINSWGMVIVNNVIWVANNATGLITSYDLSGNKLPTTAIVDDAAGIPAFPTGIAFNGTNGFVISNGTTSAPATLLIATENGTINAYNPTINPTTSLVAINNAPTGSVYKGIATAGFYLYAANFSLGRIDVYNSSFTLIRDFAFADGSGFPVPSAYSPFNIQYINGLLYVTYALRNPSRPADEIPGPGNGFINVFNTNGTFVRRLVTGGYLNAPWAIIPIPNTFGNPRLLGGFLVGNFGDGAILVYDKYGVILGRLITQSATPISIDGLWGLATASSSSKLIYFAAGPNEETNGLVGYLTPTWIY